MSPELGLRLAALRLPLYSVFVSRHIASEGLRRGPLCSVFLHPPDHTSTMWRRYTSRLEDVDVQGIGYGLPT